MSVEVTSSPPAPSRLHLQAWLRTNSIIGLRVASTSATMTLIVSVMIVILVQVSQGRSEVNLFGLDLEFRYSEGLPTMWLVLGLLCLWLLLSSVSTLVTSHSVTHALKRSTAHKSGESVNVNSERELYETFVGLVVMLGRLAVLSIVLMVSSIWLAPLAIVQIVSVLYLGKRKFEFGFALQDTLQESMRGWRHDPDGDIRRKVVALTHEREVKVARVRLRETFLLLLPLLLTVLGLWYVGGRFLADGDVLLILLMLQSSILAITGFGRFGRIWCRYRRLPLAKSDGDDSLEQEA